MPAPPPGPLPLCYHRGRLRPTAEALVPALSLAARYAVCVFEGVRLYRPRGGGRARPLALAAHLGRLANSTAGLGMPAAAAQEAAAAVDLLLARQPVTFDAYLRVAVWAANSGPLGTLPEAAVTVTAAALGRRRPPSGGGRLRVMVGPWQRADARVVPHHIKAVGPYLGAQLALCDARARGFDSCILVDGAGELCEGPTAAVFVVTGGVVSTPPLAAGCLPSITRRLVLHLGRQRGLLMAERPLSRDDLVAADEAFLAGTAAELAPIGAVDGHRLPAANPTTRALRAAYFAAARAPARPAGGQRSRPST